MEVAHNGFNIKTHIVNCCKNFHLIDKIFSISLYNVTAITKVIDFLKEDPSNNMLLGGSLMHVRCCAHILNLCIQEGLEYGLRKKVISLDIPPDGIHHTCCTMPLHIVMF
ncbi:putative AC transposase [Bienertia sinuspersici]